VTLAATRLRPSQIITERSIENALRVLLAIGGSTNAVIISPRWPGALASRSRSAPERAERRDAVLVDLKPTGQHYMSDLNAAGGLGAVLASWRPCSPGLHDRDGPDARRAARAEKPWVDRDVVRPLADPYQKVGGLAALFGSLAPGGAIIKRSAADPRSSSARDGRWFSRPSTISRRASTRPIST
jgi:dihydroxy-acid dehydratase